MKGKRWQPVRWCSMKDENGHIILTVRRENKGISRYDTDQLTQASRVRLLRCFFTFDDIYVDEEQTTYFAASRTYP